MGYTMTYACDTHYKTYITHANTRLYASMIHADVRPEDKRMRPRDTHTYSRVDTERKYSLLNTVHSNEGKQLNAHAARRDQAEKPQD